MQPAVDAGEACVFGAECTSLTCVASADGCSRCAPVLAEGAPCSNDDVNLGVCAPGFACLLDGDGPTRRCILATPRPFVDVEEGGYCDYLALQRTYETCAPTLYCGSDHTCHPRRTLGSECEPWFEQCGEDLICRAAGDGTNRCLATRIESALGAACDVVVEDTYRACDHFVGLTCDPGEGVCLRHRAYGGADGNACSLGADCASGNCGRSGTCEPVAAAPDGSPCFLDEMCASAYCDLGVCSSLEASCPPE